GSAFSASWSSHLQLPVASRRLLSNQSLRLRRLPLHTEPSKNKQPRRVRPPLRQSSHQPSLIASRRLAQPGSYQAWSDPTSRTTRNPSPLPTRLPVISLSGYVLMGLVRREPASLKPSRPAR